MGLGLLGGSIGLAVQESLPGVATTGWDRDPATRARAAERGLVGTVCETGAEAVADADLVIFCVPVGAIGEVATELASAIPAGAVISDVGSSKQSVAEALAKALPGHAVIPAHPVAGTER
ncbi:MAG: prephenate dehydrogenase/arogenate dehydrogenase family protein, partial [Novosphingobium sp.]